jgi:hypothetical protein
MTLAKAFIAAFGLNEKSYDAQRLLNWKRPEDVGNKGSRVRKQYYLSVLIHQPGSISYH